MAKIFRMPFELRWWLSSRSPAFRDAVHSGLPSWSTLRTLGTSKVVGATMLVPFLGTLLLFNQAFIDAIRIPEEIMNVWGVNLSISSKDVSLIRLKLTYFGLCFIGIAAFIFTLMCPEIVKRYASSAEFVRGDEPLFTGTQVEEAAGTTIGNFIRLTKETEFGREPTFSCPQALYRQTYIFIGELTTLMLKREEEEERLYREANPEIGSQAPENSDETEEEEAERRSNEERYFFWDHYSLGIDVDKVLDRIEDGNRYAQSMNHTLSSIGREFPADVMSLSYLWQNHSRPFVRLLISLIFFTGFTLLSIPTIFTFISVLRQTLS